MKTLIYNGRVIDPANHVDGKLNLLIEDGKIAWAGKGMPEADRMIDATGKIVTPEIPRGIFSRLEKREIKSYVN